MPADSRIACNDTVLPKGGGPDGSSPVFVKAGTMVAYHMTALHRRKDLWGDDAEIFDPGRWNKENDVGSWVRLIARLWHKHTAKEF